MTTTQKHTPGNTLFFLICYSMLIILVSFVAYLEYQWYAVNHGMPELVFNFSSLTNAY